MSTVEDRDRFYELLEEAIEKDDYDEAFRLLDTVYNIYDRELNCILFLLSVVTFVPPKYEDISQKINFGCIKIQDAHSAKDMQQNNIRRYIVLKYFEKVLNLLEKQKNPSAFDKVVKKLVTKAYKISEEKKKHIRELATQQKYDEIIKYYKETNPGSITQKDMIINELAEVANRLASGEVIPFKIPKPTEKFEVAIKNGDYKLAAFLYVGNAKHPNKAKDSTINILLCGIINMMEMNSSNSIISLRERKKYNELRSLIDRIHRKLKETNGIELLGLQKNRSLDDICGVVREYPDLDYVIIFEDSEPQVVIKYKGNKEGKNVSKLLEQAGNLYANKEYEKALDIYLDVLSFSPKKTAYLYYHIGQCLMKLNCRNRAIPYLLVSTYYAIKNNEGDIYDCTGVLTKFGIEVPDVKPIVSDFDIGDFYTISNSFGIDVRNFNVDGQTILEACQEKGLDVDEICRILLAFALEAYKQGNIEYGDELIRQVNSFKDRPSYIAAKIDEIRKQSWLPEDKSPVQFRKSMIYPSNSSPE